MFYNYKMHIILSFNNTEIIDKTLSVFYLCFCGYFGARSYPQKAKFVRFGCDTIIRDKGQHLALGRMVRLL